MDEFPPSTGDEKGRVVLEVKGEAAEGRRRHRRVENEQAAQPAMPDEAVEALVGDIVGKPDGQDGVVEVQHGGSNLSGWRMDVRLF